MITANQAKLAFDSMNEGLKLCIPLGILWQTKVNLLVNCKESRLNKSVLISTDKPSIKVQFIRLNSNDKPCRYWGTYNCDTTSADSVDRSIQLHITEQLGMKRDRKAFLTKTFCGGYNAESQILTTPFVREMAEHDYDNDDIMLENF